MQCIAFFRGLTMFRIKWSDEKTMSEKTEQCYALFKHVRKFYDLQTELYGVEEPLWFGDDVLSGVEIDEISKCIILTIKSELFSDTVYKGHNVSFAYYRFRFDDVEDICIEGDTDAHIDDIYIQKDKDGRFSYCCEGPSIQFTFETAEALECWTE